MLPTVKDTYWFDATYLYCTRNNYRTCCGAIDRCVTYWNPFDILIEKMLGTPGNCILRTIEEIDDAYSISKESQEVGTT